MEGKFLAEYAELTVRGRTVRLPIIEGTHGEIGLDIGTLRADTGAITVDIGLANTGTCTSSITYIDGEDGILRFRGYDIADLAEKCSFLEVAFLLLRGELPTADEYERFSYRVLDNMMIHEDLRHFFDAFPKDAHPMAVAAAVVGSLATFYPESMNPKNLEEVRESTRRLIAKLPTIIAFSYKHSLGRPVVYPRCDLEYTENFLHMLFSTPYRLYETPKAVTRAMELIFLLHADHEQNCSTSTVRMVGSSQANLFASVAAGVSALWGPLHGGANQAVIEMLQSILEEGISVRQYIDQIKDKRGGRRLMGFGHRVYKNYDPRAKVLRAAAQNVLDELGIHNPLLETAMELERIALQDDYFIERGLYPNVDFYSGIILHAIGIPLTMFTAVFAIGRMPGWLAQWREMHADRIQRIARPRQVYVGKSLRTYVPFSVRGDGREPKMRVCRCGA